jgi:hypothetical protein
VAAVTLTIVPKDIEARILIADRKAVNSFLKKSFAPSIYSSAGG